MRTAKRTHCYLAIALATYFVLRNVKLKTRHTDANRMPSDPRLMIVTVTAGCMVTNSLLGVPSFGTNPITIMKTWLVE